MLFKHSGIYILAKLIPGLMAFAALSLYTHFLTPEEYGIYTLIFTGTVFLHNVIYNWLSAGTLRYWSNKDFSNKEFTNTLSLTLLKITAVVFIIALIGVIIFWKEQESQWIFNSLFFLIALAIFTITGNIYSAKIEPKNYAFLTISYSIGALFFGALLAYLGYGASGAITGIAIGTILPALFVFRKTWFPFDASSHNKLLLKKLLAYGLPLAAAALVEEITKVTDRFMLAGLQDNAQAGLYAVGYDLSGNSILMLMAAINIAAYPVIIKLLDSDGVKAATDYFRHYAVLLLAISVPAVIGLNLVGPNLVYLLIDKAYQDSVIFLLPWVTVAIFLLGMQVFYFDLAFQLGQKTIASVKIAVAIAIINIGLNFWLIPKMGIQGAAISTITSFAVGSVLSAYFGKRYFTLPFPVIELLKICLATIVMGMTIWWLRDAQGWGWLTLQLLLGCSSYFIIMLFFNILDIRTHSAKILLSR